MSNGTAECAAPAKEGSFFDKTENNYRNMTQRGQDCRDRIDAVCDSIGGGQPREAQLTKGQEHDRHPAAFDRCNSAESDMYSSMNMLEEAILRLENLGLT